MEGKEKPPSVPAVGNPALEDKCSLCFDGVQRLIGSQSGVYQKKPFTLLAPSATNCGILAENTGVCGPTGV